MLYHNVKRHCQWINRGNRSAQLQRDRFHPKKRMLSVRWDIQGIVHFKQLNNNLKQLPLTSIAINFII